MNPRRGNPMKRRFCACGLVLLLFISAFAIPVQTIESEDDEFIRVTTDKYCYDSFETVEIEVEGDFTVLYIAMLSLLRPIIFNDSGDVVVEPLRFNGIIQPALGTFIGTRNYTWNQTYMIYNKTSPALFPPPIPPSGQQVPKGKYTIYFGWWVENMDQWKNHLMNITTPAHIKIGDCSSGPTADAGHDQTIYEGQEVHLDGNGSKGGGWRIEAVDNEGYHYTSIAMDSNDYPHISYQGWFTDLKYARWTGSAWSIETLDSTGWVGYSTSIALDSNGYPHISYNSHFYFLKYAKWTGSAWSIETVVGEVNLASVSMALDSSGYPHIAYTGGLSGDKDLKYARWTGSAWSIETVDDQGQLSSPSIALDSIDYAHIGYHDSYPNRDLKYARWTGSVWSIEIVESAGSVGLSPSIALDNNGYPHIAYASDSPGNPDLKYARWTGSAWSIETVGSGGASTSMALDNSGYQHISYFDVDNRDLKYAKWTGSAWSIETVGSAGSVWYSVSIALDSSGYPHISCGNLTNHALMYAKWTGGSNIISYEWDFTSDGSYDYMETNASAPDGDFDGKTTHVYGDNGIYQATLRITDENGATDMDTVNITVKNIAPTITGISAHTLADVTLRLAGEKWHDATIYLYEKGTEIGSATVVRFPGNPDDQSVTIEDVYLDLTKEYSAQVVYTPDDDPINGQPNGANPAWIILTFEDGTEERIHHIFNVMHPETWEWDIVLSQYLAGHEVTLESSATDSGSDDLTFDWGLGIPSIYYNDGANPDPYPSPDGVFPFEVKDVFKYEYPGSGILTLNVTDDDGGLATATITLA
jgi:hypothetical protein